jgi:hypothetical protein
VEEPPDKPESEPGSPVHEPGPHEPKRWAGILRLPALAFCPALKILRVNYRPAKTSSVSEADFLHI